MTAGVQGQLFGKRDSLSVETPEDLVLPIRGQRRNALHVV